MPQMIPRLAIACSLFTLSLLLDAAGASAVHQLTLDNFEKLVDGKNVFIKVSPTKKEMVLSVKVLCNGLLIDRGFF